MILSNSLGVPSHFFVWLQMDQIVLNELIGLTQS